MLDPNKHGVYNKVGWQGKTKQQVQFSNMMVGISVIGFILLMGVVLFMEIFCWLELDAGIIWNHHQLGVGLVGLKGWFIMEDYLIYYGYYTTLSMGKSGRKWWEMVENTII